MSNERKIDYDKIERYLLPHERCTLPSHPDIWVKDILTIIRNARQLAAERERGKVLRDAMYLMKCCRNLADVFHQDGSRSRDCCEHMAAHALAEIGESPQSPYAPANPCPDCGATDRAHTCPNWRESQAPDKLVSVRAHQLADAILAAVDARLKGGK